MKLNKLKARKNWLLAEPITEKEEISGLVRPEQYDEKVSRAKVILIDAETAKESGIKKGNTVFFNPYAPTELTLDNVKYLCLNIEDILFYTI